MHSEAEGALARDVPFVNKPEATDGKVDDESPGIDFLGYPDSQAKEVNGLPVMTEVRETDYATYESSKSKGAILDEERHGDWIYWSTDSSMCVSIGDAEAIIGVTERHKARVPDQPGPND